MARSQGRTPHHVTAATIRNIIHRLDALEHRMKRSRSGAQDPSELARRWAILEENRLRDQVERDEAFRKHNPEFWRQLEIGRRAQNKKTALLNRRLRAEGLRPVALAPSLAQQVKKLRQLEARNNARTAKRKASE